MDFTELLPSCEDQEARADKKALPINPNVISVAVAIILVLSVVFLGVTLKGLHDENVEIKRQLAEERKIDVTYIGDKLESISELATAKMTYNGIIHFTDGKIPFITKKEFYMSYRVSVKAGFDLSKAEIRVTENTVTITLAEAEIYEPIVDESSFQFFDKSIAIFNPEKMDDLTEAISEAKDDVLAQPETEELKENAQESVKALLAALLEGQIGERDLIINIG